MFSTRLPHLSVLLLSAVIIATVSSAPLQDLASDYKLTRAQPQAAEEAPQVILVTNALKAFPKPVQDGRGKGIRLRGLPELDNYAKTNTSHHGKLYLQKHKIRHFRSRLCSRGMRRDAFGRCRKPWGIIYFK